MATIKSYYCKRYNRKVKVYNNHYCLGCFLYPLNIGECPDRINLDNK